MYQCRRRVIVLVALLSGGLALILWLLLYQESDRGWEGIFAGHRTAYWKGDLAQWRIWSRVSFKGCISREWERVPSFLDHAFGRNADSSSLRNHPLMQGNPESIPVLVELLGCENANVQLIALQAVRMLGANAIKCAPSLEKLLNNSNQELRNEASSVLKFVRDENENQERGH
jgi:hypothetical protein